MKIIVGLGNPGKTYENTYHNVGFDVIDKLAKKLGVKFSLKSKLLAYTAQLTVKGERVVLVKPQTYMNLSGDSISATMRFFKAEFSDLLVVYDDLDIEISSIRFKTGGSSGTHNGMRDIIDKLASAQFARLRIGTAKDDDYITTVDYVLSKISTEKRILIDEAVDRAVNLSLDFIGGASPEKIMCIYNGKKRI